MDPLTLPSPPFFQPPEYDDEEEEECEDTVPFVTKTAHRPVTSPVGLMAAALESRRSISAASFTSDAPMPPSPSAYRSGARHPDAESSTTRRSWLSTAPRPPLPSPSPPSLAEDRRKSASISQRAARTRWPSGTVVNRTRSSALAVASMGIPPPPPGRSWVGGGRGGGPGPR